MFVFGWSFIWLEFPLHSFHECCNLFIGYTAVVPFVIGFLMVVVILGRRCFVSAVYIFPESSSNVSRSTQGTDGAFIWGSLIHGLVLLALSFLSNCLCSYSLRSFFNYCVLVCACSRKVFEIPIFSVELWFVLRCSRWLLLWRRVSNNLQLVLAGCISAFVRFLDEFWRICFELVALNCPDRVTWWVAFFRLLAAVVVDIQNDTLVLPLDGGLHLSVTDGYG